MGWNLGQGAFGHDFLLSLVDVVDGMVFCVVGLIVDGGDWSEGLICGTMGSKLRVGDG